MLSILHFLLNSFSFSSGDICECPLFLYFCGMQSELIKQAKAHGMCTENFRALMSCKDKSEMIALYKKTIDWALEEGYPSLSVLQKEFGHEEDNGIYVGHAFRGELLDDQQVYVFHQCSGTIRVRLNVSKRIIPMLYFANGCNMRVRCEEDIRVPIYIFGENNVRTENVDGLTEFRIYNFEVK